MRSCRLREVVQGRSEVYRVLEDVHTLAGPRTRDPVHRVRRILVHSTAVAAGRLRAARSVWPGPGRRWTSSPVGGRPARQDPREGHGPGRGHRRQAARHRLPALDHHHRRARRPRPGLARRPGRPECRGRRRRLVRDADQHLHDPDRTGPDRPPHPRRQRARSGPPGAPASRGLKVDVPAQGALTEELAVLGRAADPPRRHWSNRPQQRGVEVARQHVGLQCGVLAAPDRDLDAELPHLVLDHGCDVASSGWSL